MLKEELKKEYCSRCANKGLCESDTPIIKHCLDRKDGSLRNKPKWFKAHEDEAHARAEDFCHKNCTWHNMGKCLNDCKTCLMYKIYLAGFIDGEREVTYMTADEYDKTLDKCKECYSNMVEKFSKRNEDLEKTVEELQLNLRLKNDLIEDITEILNMNDHVENIHNYLCCLLNLRKVDECDCEICSFDCEKRLAEQDIE